jgi:hypothetical protein
MAPTDNRSASIEQCSAELRRLWPEFWRFLVVLDRLLNSAGAMEQTLTAGVRPGENVTAPVPSPGAAPSEPKAGITDSGIGECAGEARGQFLATWGDLIRRYATELTDKEWIVASLCYHHGFAPAQIAEYYQRLGQPHTPRSVSAVYALLQRARDRCRSAARRECARSPTKKGVE